MGAATAANVLRDVAIPGRSTAVAVILGIWLAGVAAAPASAAVFNVNTVADPAGAGCTGGTCSFRQAVEAVNAGAGTGEMINLPAGHYRLTLGDVRADLPVSIVGGGARSTILDALSVDGLLYFQVGSSPSALSGVTLTGGRTGGGAGLYNEVALTVSEVAVTGNTATGSTAGGISNRATAVMTLDRSL